jgi:DNA invertase Pin-like site-specific DNA recombinase
MEDIRTFGYVRVSTKEQHEDRQLIAMQEFGVAEECVYRDKQSGKDFDRPGFQALMSQIRQGDVLVVKSIDRLGRDYQEILNHWRIITKERQCAIVVLDMPMLDTREKENRDLTGTFVADLVLNILSYVAETERAYTRQRQREGIAAAKAKGIQFGRPPIKRTAKWYQMREAWRCKKITARSAATVLGIDHKTFLLWVNDN